MRSGWAFSALWGVVVGKDAAGGIFKTVQEIDCYTDP